MSGAPVSLRKNPDQRPASARQMRAQLEEVRDAAGHHRPSTDRSTLSDQAEGPLAKSGRKERSRLWLAVAGGAVLVTAVAAFAFVKLGGKGEGQVAPASASPTEPAAGPAWPEAHRVAGDEYQVDERFEEDRLRVISVAKRDPKNVLAAVRQARRDFQTYLSAHGVARQVAALPLNVVIVPPERMCDARLYESGAAPAGCQDKVSQYRPREKTLYLADDEDAMAANLPLAVATTMCLHSEVEPCDALVVPFAQAALER